VFPQKGHDVYLISKFSRSSREEEHHILAVSGVQVIGGDVLTALHARWRRHNQRGKKKWKESLENHLGDANWVE
jgi:hypothetical protein